MLKKQISVIEILKIFYKFPKIASLKPNKLKCEIAGIGALTGVRVVLCSMQCINLNDQIVKILEKIQAWRRKKCNNHTANIKKYGE